MIIIKAPKDLTTILGNHRKSGTLGFVPTMGALHQGHISLLNTAKSKNSQVIASIFVNPTQFNDPKDFEKYPQTLENDIHMLENAGCHYLFLPSIQEMYPQGTSVQKHYELGEIETKLEGIFRPGHFQGVCNIVDRLFQIIQPDDVYFGQKDYQQCLVVKKMMHLRGYKFDMNICPIIREVDGLAMSSRNMRLNNEQRTKAHLIYDTLTDAKNEMQPGSLVLLKQDLQKRLNSFGFNTEYLEFSDPETLETIEYWDGYTNVVILIAAFLGDIRLIDNIVVSKSN